MLTTALAALSLLFAVQGLLVVKLADHLTERSTGNPSGRVDALQPGGRYAQLA